MGKCASFKPSLSINVRRRPIACILQLSPRPARHKSHTEPSSDYPQSLKLKREIVP
jgi:hypothetical protein